MASCLPLTPSTLTCPWESCPIQDAAAAGLHHSSVPDEGLSPSCGCSAAKQWTPWSSWPSPSPQSLYPKTSWQVPTCRPQSGVSLAPPNPSLTTEAIALFLTLARFWTRPAGSRCLSEVTSWLLRAIRSPQHSPEFCLTPQQESGSWNASLIESPQLTPLQKREKRKTI